MVAEFPEGGKCRTDFDRSGVVSENLDYTLLVEPNLNRASTPA